MAVRRIFEARSRERLRKKAQFEMDQERKSEYGKEDPAEKGNSARVRDEERDKRRERRPNGGIEMVQLRSGDPPRKERDRQQYRSEKQQSGPRTFSKLAKVRGELKFFPIG